MQSDIIPTESIVSNIILIRGEKCLLDRDLAILYSIETRVLKQAVKRNIDRFPEDFMFKLENREIDFLVSQSVIPEKRQFGGAIPMAFTEQGVAMLSSVLKSPRAVQVNIAIMRAFVKMRKLLASHEELQKKIEDLESKYDNNFKIVFQALKELMQPPPDQTNKKFGFRITKG